MSDLRSVVAKGVFNGIGDRHAAGMPVAAIVDAVTRELRANADVVRMEMELEVWGMVR